MNRSAKVFARTCALAGEGLSKLTAMSRVPGRTLALKPPCSCETTERFHPSEPGSAAGAVNPVAVNSAGLS